MEGSGRVNLADSLSLCAQTSKPQDSLLSWTDFLGRGPTRAEKFLEAL